MIWYLVWDSGPQTIIIMWHKVVNKSDENPNPFQKAKTWILTSYSDCTLGTNDYYPSKIDTLHNQSLIWETFNHSIIADINVGDDVDQQRMTQ